MKKVFLGGSCNPTTWRRDIAIPKLETAGVDYFNPQVDVWTSECVDIEAREKAAASHLLFVIDGATRALASMIEATEYASKGRNVVVVIHNITDGTKIADQTVTGRELKDLNNARVYLHDALSRCPSATICMSIEAAVEHLIK